MKLYVKSPIADRGIARVVGALTSYAPQGVEITDDIADSDLVVIHVTGRNEHVGNHIRILESCKKPYVMIQYALRSTRQPLVSQWMPYWTDARLVWSYYNLLALCEEDGMRPDFRFYHSPLGTEFDHPASERRYKIATSGIGYLQESVRECIHAARMVGEKAFHVGPQVHPDLECSNGMDDYHLAIKYSQCEFVAGLRRNEGFEYPVIEGLMCGARPICFDRPHYRQWFHDLAVFIPEEPREKVILSLFDVFRAGARPVTDAERAIVRKRFDWRTIIGGFYAQLL